MVDAGKTMRDAVLAQFPKFNLSSVDGVLLTHGHADAILGLDDLRDLQVISEVRDGGRSIGYAAQTGPIEIVANAATLRRAREAFPYLSDNVAFVRKGVLERRVAHLEWREIADDTKTTVAGLPLRSFPVYHGGTYVSLGFAFGPRQSFVYISDVSALPDASRAYLLSLRGRLRVLIVDALRRTRSPTHFSLDEALALVRELRPPRTWLTGVASCEMGDHDEVNAELRTLWDTEGLAVQLAHDGLHIPAEYL
eukprot:EG_transcript_23940